MALPFLAQALDGGEWSPLCSGHFTPGERAPCTHLMEDWVAPRAGLDAVEKRTISYTCRKWNPGRQPVAPRYTDEAILVKITTISVLTRS
jgi:hypothetical protein